MKPQPKKVQLKKGKDQEETLFVVLGKNNLYIKAEDGDVGIHLVTERFEAGTERFEAGKVYVLEPKPWAIYFPLKAMRRFVEDANFKPWTSEEQPRKLDAIYFF